MTSTTDSSSWHKLTGDFGLSKVQRVMWMLYNAANNALPHVGVDRRIRATKFSVSESELTRLWDDVVETASPARRLCDMFWMTLPWSAIAQELKPVQALEIGCGSGVYGRLLKESLGPAFGRYVGVDIEANDEWQSTPRDSGFQFEVSRASEASQFLPGSNFILTQSALEHFEEDLSYFRQVADHVAASQHPVFQVHMVPSASCILTYPWHGIRTYTPRTISRITRLFDDDTSIYLFALGGAQCNKVHRNFVTWPYYRHRVDLRFTKNEDYQRALLSAILSDERGSQNKPAFYALVLASRFSQPVFGA